MLGPRVVILDKDSHNISIDPVVRRTSKISLTPLVIGKNVWVGMHFIIIKGVQIRDNSIIASQVQSLHEMSLPKNFLARILPFF